MLAPSGQRETRTGAGEGGGGVSLGAKKETLFIKSQLTADSLESDGHNDALLLDTFLTWDMISQVSCSWRLNPMFFINI